MLGIPSIHVVTELQVSADAADDGHSFLPVLHVHTQYNNNNRSTSGGLGGSSGLPRAARR